MEIIYKYYKGHHYGCVNYNFEHPIWFNKAYASLFPTSYEVKQSQV